MHCELPPDWRTSTRRPPNTISALLSHPLLRSDEVLLSGRSPAVAGDSVRLERFGQRHAARVVAREGGLQLRGDALAQPLGSLRAKLLEIGEHQPSAGAPGHAEIA